VSGNGQHGRRGRRLTLAPAIMRALRPSSPLAVADEEDADDKDDRRWAEGRAALSRAVSLAVEASQRPKLIHGVQVQAGASPIRSKFWSVGATPTPRRMIQRLLPRRSSSRMPSTLVSRLIFYPELSMLWTQVRIRRLAIFVSRRPSSRRWFKEARGGAMAGSSTRTSRFSTKDAG
jgi:hypothetical protein